MGIISIENTDHLYWLGRYIERVGTTIELFAENYDYTLDSGIGRYDEFCQNWIFLIYILPENILSKNIVSVLKTLIPYGLI